MNKNSFVVVFGEEEFSREFSILDITFIDAYYQGIAYMIEGEFDYRTNCTITNSDTEEIREFIYTEPINYAINHELEEMNEGCRCNDFPPNEYHTEGEK